MGMSRKDSQVRFGAITLDTEVFVRNGYRLEAGLLAQLTQFKNSPIQFILSEVVIGEMFNHVIANTKNAEANFKNAVQKSKEHGLFSCELHDQLSKISSSISQPKDAVETRLTDFIHKTSAEIIPIKTVDICDVVKRYFNSSPPFEKQEKKKHEFPDAIALLSLEDWAESQQMRILAVSHDRGWKNFAAESKWIVVKDDLASALAELQTQADTALHFMNRFISDLESGKHPDAMDFMEKGLLVEISGEYAEAQASSFFFFFTNDGIDLDYKEFEFLRDDDGFDVNIVQISGRQLVARIGLFITANAAGHFSFFVEHGDYRPIGSCYEITEAGFRADVLVTVTGNLSSADDEEIEISAIELVEIVDAINFGTIDPDFD